MKKIFNTFVCGIMSLILVILGVFSVSMIQGKTRDVNVRSIELGVEDIDSQSVMNEFDSYDMSYENHKVDFTGYKALSSSLFNELDGVSDTGIQSEVLTKYDCTYDTENGIVTLSVSKVQEEETIIIDTMYGVIISDENGNFDVAFDCEGELLLLSELQESGAIENCGFWSKIKKVWNTTAGKVGAVITVATCAVVGVVCAVVPGGQLVTAVCIGVAVGAVGGAITAGIATYQIDGKIDWAAVGCFAGLGAVIGGATAAASFKLTSAIKNVFPKANPKDNISSYNSYSKFKSQHGKASQYINNGEWHHIVEQQTVTKGINPANSVYNTKNTVAISKDLHVKITSYYNTSYGSWSTYRSYINTLPYEQQYVEGLKVLKMFAEKLGETIIWL